MEQGATSCHFWLKAKIVKNHFCTRVRFLRGKSQLTMVAGVCEVISTLMAQLLYGEGINIIFKSVERLLRQGVETCIGKTTPVLCLLCVFFIPHTPHSEYFISCHCQWQGGFSCVCFFPHTKQCCNTSWVPYHLTQFWHSLSGDIIRSYRPRTQSQKTAPHFRWQQLVIGPQVTHNSWLQIRGSHDLLPLGFELFAQVAHKTQGRTHLWLSVCERIW